MRHANHIFSAPYCVVLSGLHSCTMFFHIILQTGRGFRINFVEEKMRVLTFSTTLSEKCLILRKIKRDIIINVDGSSCTVPVILVGV
jgi:hypothetical protein